MRGTGILTCFPSTTPFGLALGVDSPCADERCAGTLGLSARRIFTSFIVTHVSIRTSDTSTGPPGPTSQAYRTLPYQRSISFEPIVNRRLTFGCVYTRGFTTGADDPQWSRMRRFAPQLRYTV